MTKQKLTVSIPEWVLEDCGGLNVGQLIDNGQLEGNIIKINKTNEILETRLRQVKENIYFFSGTIKAILLNTPRETEEPISIIIECAGTPLRINLNQENVRGFFQNIKLEKNVTIDGKLDLQYLTCVDGELLRNPITSKVVEIFLIEKKSQKVENVSEITLPLDIGKNFFAVLEVKKVFDIDCDIEGRYGLKVVK